MGFLHPLTNERKQRIMLRISESQTPGAFLDTVPTGPKGVCVLFTCKPVRF